MATTVAAPLAQAAAAAAALLRRAVQVVVLTEDRAVKVIQVPFLDHRKFTDQAAVAAGTITRLLRLELEEQTPVRDQPPRAETARPTLAAVVVVVVPTE